MDTTETPAAPAQTGTPSEPSENQGVNQLAALFAASRQASAVTPAEEPSGQEVSDAAVPEETESPSDEVQGDGTEVEAETGEANAEAESTVESQDDAEPGESVEEEPRGVAKRIHKLTAKLKTASDELSAARQEIERLKGAQPQLPDKAPTLDVAEAPEVVAIDREIATHRTIKDWCEANPDGGEVMIGGKSYGTVNADRVAAMLRESDSALSGLRARREARVVLASERVEAQRREWTDKANQAFPFLNSKSGPEYAKALEIIGGFTQGQRNALLANPQGLFLLGAAVKGLQSMEVPKAATMPRKAPPKVPAKPAGAAPKSSSPRAQLEEQLRQATDRYRQSGRGVDFSRMESLKQQLKRVA